jgi:hypothetical protein
MSTPNPSRREFVKRIPYVAPAVLSLAAAPEYAKAGSGKWGGSGDDGKKDKEPKGGKAKGKK